MRPPTPGTRVPWRVCPAALVPGSVGTDDRVCAGPGQRREGLSLMKVQVMVSSKGLSDGGTGSSGTWLNPWTSQGPVDS